MSSPCRRLFGRRVGRTGLVTTGRNLENHPAGSQATRARRAMACALESLEERVMLSSIQWNGGTGDWSDAADWSSGTVPTDNDDVTIPAGSNVTISATTATVDSLTTDSGSTLTLASGAQLNPENGGTISGTFNWNGTISGDNSVLTFAGTTVVTGGSDGGDFANTGNLTFEGGGLVGGQFTNSGSVTVTGGIILGDGATFTNLQGATFTITDDSSFAEATYPGLTSGTFINEGTFTKSGGAGTSEFPAYSDPSDSDYGAEFENVGGTINISSGDFTFHATMFLQNGELNVAKGSTLTFLCGDSGGPFNVNLSGTLTGSGGGTLALDQGYLQNEDPSSNYASATLNFPSGMVQVAGVDFVELDNLPFANDGYLNLAGSTANGVGTFGGGDFTNNGTITVTNGIVLGDGATLMNSQGATFTITDDSSFAETTYPGLTSGTFINEGTFTKSGGTGTSEFPAFSDPSDPTYGAEFENIGGTINIDSGSFTIRCTVALQNGQINVTTGSTVTFDCGDSSGPFNVTLAGTLTGSGGGTIVLAAGSYYAQAPDESSSNATLDFPSGMVQVENVEFQQAGDSTLTNAGALDFVSSIGYGPIVMVNQGTVTVTGTADLPFQDFVNGAMGILDLETDAGITNGGGNIDLTNEGVLRKSGDTGTTVISGSFFNDAGSIDIETGSVTLQQGSFGYIAGPLYIATGSVLDLALSNGMHLQGTLSSTGGGVVTVTSGWIDGPNADYGEDTTVPAELNFAPGILTFDGGFLDETVDTYVTNIGTLGFASSGGPLGIFSNSGTVNFDGGQFDVEKGSQITNLAGGVINFNAPTVLLTEAINCRIVNQGLIVVNAGNSTMDLATPYPYDVYTGAPALTNDGTIEVASGTLIYPSVSLETNGVIPAGAGYEVDAGATLTTETPVSVATNAGSVTLQGLGAEFPAIASLTTNNGTFAVLSGASFSTKGSLTNTGTLSVGGAVTVNGNLTESVGSSTLPVLDFPVAAAASSSDAPKLKVTGSTTLAGNLTAEYSDGFAAAAGNSYTVASFASPATGSFASTAGVMPDFSTTVSPTSILLNSTGFGAAALDVSSVTAPATFTPGQVGAITWTVKNTGAATDASWTDSVFLSTDGTVGAGDLLLGRVTHTGGLAAGASYTGSLTAPFPAAAGTYTIVVESDSGQVVTQTTRAGDAGFSSSITSSLPALTLGGSVSGTLSAGEDLLYTLAIPGGTDVRVSASFAAPALTDLEISRGAVPSDGSAEYTVPLSTTSNILATTIPQPQAGTYYILLQGQTAAGSGQAFTLSASAVSFGAFGVSPSTVGAGPVSLNITGAGFSAGSSVALVNGNQIIASATSVTASNPNTLVANFNLAGVPTGTYSLRITTGTNSATLASAITVQPADTNLAPVQFSLDAPSAARYGHVYDLLVQYTNPNNVEVPAPIFQLSATNGEFELVSGNLGADLNPDTLFSEGTIVLMAINQEGAAGVLPPGYTGVYDVRFTAINNIPDSTIDVTLGVADPTAPFDLSDIVQPGPDGVSEVTAEILAEQIDGLSTLPTTLVSGSGLYPQSPNLDVPTGALNSYLDSIASDVSTAGIYTPNVTSLIDTATSAADGFGAVTQRQIAGPFGQGTPDPLLFEVVSPYKGLDDVVMPGGTEQFVQAGSGFVATNPANTDTLATEPGGMLRLTELDGSFYQFNTNGYLAYYQTEGGLRTTLNYNANNNVTSIVAPGNQVTDYSYSSSGLVISSTDPFGNVTTYGYTISNSVPLLTSITTPAGTTTLTYTQTPKVESEGGSSYETSSPALAFLPTLITLPDGSGEEFTYDGLGRLTKTTLLDGSDPITESYDATGLGVTTTFADGSTETDLYGPGGVLLKSTDATGNTTSFTFGPNLLLTSILAPGGAQTSLTYNSQNELSSGAGPTGTETRLTYDSEGHVTGITDGNGNTVAETYDSNSNLTSLTFPDGTQTQFAYNSVGQLDQVTGRDGSVTSFTLNSSGEPTEISYSDGVTMSYSYAADGDLLTSTDSSGTTTYTYNAAQQVTEISYPNGQSVSYRYDSKGQVTQESDQSGVLETYTYDADARLVEVMDGSGNLLVAYTYDDLSRVSMETFGNGTKTVYSYDANDNVASIINLAPDGTVSSSLAYTYNAQGEPLTSTDQSGNVTSYAYDLSGQLTQVTLPGGRTITYNYDADGNRTSVVDSAGTETATYSANDLDEYTAVGTTTYTYNENGDLQSMTNSSGTTSYTYNEVGQLASSTGPAGTFTYSYNALDQLDSYTINGVRTNLLLDIAGNVIAAYNASGDLIANYEYGLQLVSQQAPGGSNSFYDFDLTGNTTAITNSVGATVNTYSYLPFGEKLSSTGAAGNLFTYSGAAGVLDLGDGFYQTTYRTYSPTLGRFIQPDPSGFAGGDVNLYRYVSNGPTDGIDPSGLAGVPGGWEGAADDTAAESALDEGVSGLFKEAEDVAIDTGANICEALVRDEAATFAAALPEVEVPPVAAAVEGVGQVKVVADEAYYVYTGGGALIKITRKALPVLLPFFFAAKSKPASAESLRPPAPPVRPVTWWADDPNLRDDYLDWVIKFKYRMTLYNSTDPNEIVGTSGAGTNQEYITPAEPLSYTVYFENEPTASGPAQDVSVTTTLDSNVDLSTFQLQSIGWGSEVLDVPPGLTSYSTQVSYVQPNTGQTILVNVSAALDVQTRTLTWTFATLDPTTLDTPADALAGFLPPDNSSGQGEGFVSYTVDPKAGLPTGTVVNAKATVVFDTNAPIATATWSNIIDASVPTSTVLALPAVTSSSSFQVSWTSSDPGGSGVAGVTVYVSDNGGPYTAFVTDSTASSALFTGVYGHTYSFYSVATSNIGAVQSTPDSPQATTALVLPPVTVTSVRWATIQVKTGSGKKAKTKSETVLQIQYSGPVSGAGNPAAYQLSMVTTKKVKKHVTTILKPIRVSSILPASTPATSSVDLTLAPRPTLGQTDELQITAAGITDALGRALDGNDDGQPGGNFVAKFGRTGLALASPSIRTGDVRTAAAAVDAVLPRIRLRPRKR